MPGGNLIPVMVYLPDDLADYLLVEADDNERSLSAHCRLILRQYRDHGLRPGGLFSRTVATSDLPEEKQAEIAQREEENEAKRAEAEARMADNDD